MSENRARCRMPILVHFEGAPPLHRRKGGTYVACQNTHFTLGVASLALRCSLVRRQKTCNKFVLCHAKIPALTLQYLATIHL